MLNFNYFFPLVKKEKVKRDTANDKILGLVNEYPQLIDEMTHFSHLSKYIYNFTQKRQHIVRNLANLTSFVINFFLVFTYAIE